MMHNPHGVFLAVLFPLFFLRISRTRVNMALPQKAAEKERGWKHGITERKFL